MSHRIEPTEVAHIEELSRNLRAQDAEEVRALGMVPAEALLHSYRQSLVANTGWIDGEIAAIWGMSGSPLRGIGQPWLLTTPAIERGKFCFVREARREVRNMLEICPALSGWVDSRYRRAIGFLGLLGFVIGDDTKVPNATVPFRPYWMHKQWA